MPLSARRARRSRSPFPTFRAGRALVPVRSLRAPSVAAVAALLAFSACAGGSEAIAPLPAPPRTSALASTTVPPDYSGVALPAVASGRTTTTSLPMGPGRATLNGRVVGPDGTPTASAMVKVERLVGGAVATTDLTAGADGTWSLPAVLGGRYRARAWRAPDLTVVNPALFFVGAADTIPVDIQLERHFGTTPIPAVAPSRPMVGQPTNLVVQVSSRSVDASGVVQGVPMVGASAELGGGAGWTVGPPNPAVTDGGGRARWELVCGANGAQPLRLTVNGAEQFQLALPACVDPPTTTTAVPGAPATTATTRGGVTTTTATRPPTTVTTRPPATTTVTTRPPATTTTARPR